MENARVAGSERNSGSQRSSPEQPRAPVQQGLEAQGSPQMAQDGKGLRVLELNPKKGRDSPS